MKITKKFLEAFSGPDVVKSITRKRDHVVIIHNNGKTSLIPRDVYNASVSRAMDQLRRDLDLLKSNFFPIPIDDNTFIFLLIDSSINNNLVVTVSHASIT